MKKRIPALLLSLVMCLSFLPAGVFAAAEQDMPSDWSKEAMEAAVENGLLQGDDLGRLNPKGLLTRAQMAAVITRAFGAAKQADLSAYADMDSGKWYYEAVSQAAFMGIMGGDGQYMNPDSDITRQEAFTVLARAMKLPAGDPAALKSFQDADAVADWAAGSMAAMVAAGYVGGSNGMLNPMGRITREEFAQVMFNIFGTYYTQAGTYTEAPARSVMVNVPDVTLKNVRVHGDIIVGDGVGEGDVTLDHVALEGRLVVRGGGVNSVHIIGDEQTWQVIIAKVDGNVRVVTEGTTKIETLTVEDGADDIIIEGSVATVNVETEGVTVKLNNAKVDKLNVVAANTAVTMSGKTEVNYLSVSEGAEGTKVEAEKTVTISNVLADTDLTLAGEAKVEKIEGTGAVTDESGEAVKETPDQTPVYVPPYTPPVTTYTVTFNSNGGSVVASQTVNANGTATRPADPTKDGYTFGGWYTDEACTTAYDFAASVTGALTLYAKWTVTVTPDTCPNREVHATLKKGITCSICGYEGTVEDPTPAVAHTHNYVEDTEAAVAPTCTTEGSKTYTCTSTEGECKAPAKTETIPALGHDWATEADENGKYPCTHEGCTEVKPDGHTCKTAEEITEWTVKQAATCTATGLRVKVCECGKLLAQETIPVIDHTPETIAGQAATCTVAGLTEGSKCSVCGLTLTAQSTIDATGHTEAADEAVAATCTTAGKTAGTHCSVCHLILTAQEETPALGHDMQEVPDSAQAATCTENGKEADKKCSRCDHTEAGAVIEALGHNKTHHAAVAATCTVAGSIEYWSCDRCNKNFSNEACTTEVADADLAVAALGHDPATAWTSDTNGHWHACSRCDEKLNEAIHTPGEWEVTKEPTATEEGTKVQKCTVCQTVMATESIPATGDEPAGQQVAAVTGVKFAEDNSWRTAELVLTPPEDESNIDRYLVSLKTASGDWVQFAELYPRNPSTSLIYTDIADLPSGTYTQIKVVSDPEWGYTENSYTASCTVTITANTYSEHIVSYYRSSPNSEGKCHYFIVAENLPTIPEYDGTLASNTLFGLRAEQNDSGWSQGGFHNDRDLRIACSSTLRPEDEASLPEQYKMYAIGGVTYTDTTLNVTTTNFGGLADLPVPQTYTFGAYDPSNIRIYQEPGDLTVRVKYDPSNQIPDTLKNYVQHGLQLTEDGRRFHVAMPNASYDPNEFDLADFCCSDSSISKNATLKFKATAEIVYQPIGSYMPDDVLVHISEELDSSLNPSVSVSGSTFTVTGLGTNAVANIQFSQWGYTTDASHYCEIADGSCNAELSENANYYQLTVYKTYEVAADGKSFTCTVAYTTDWVELPTNP